MQFALMAFFLLGVLGLCYGLFLLVFKRGFRKRGLLIALASPVLGVAGMIWSMNASVDAKARAEGWASASQESEAKRLGVADPVAFKAMEEQRLADEQAAAVERQALEVAAKEAAAAEDRRFGFHCLTGRNGSHRAFTNAVKARMREPDSFEHIETSVSAVNAEGMNALRMQYRARNGFGGMNVSTAVGMFDNSSCNYKIVAVE